MATAQRRRCACVLLVCLAATVGVARAEAPEQFRLWGSAGPDAPPVPAGWVEAGSAADGPPPSASPVEAARGAIVYVRDPLAPVGPHDRPGADERTNALRAAASRGEYEPVSFTLYALRDIPAVRVSAGALAGPGGASIPADHVDVRVVRCVRTIVSAQAKTYRLEPLLLERREAFDVPKGQSRQVWLTIKVPAEAAAGDYRGTVRVVVGQAPAAELPLSLRVLPLSLPPAAAELTVYYPQPPADEKALRRELTDIREHGCVGVEPALHVDVRSRDRDFGDDDSRATAADAARRMRAVRDVFGPPRWPVTLGAFNQVTCHWDQKKNWFVYWPHSPKVDADLLRAIDSAAEVARSAGALGVRAYTIDEAGAHNLLDEAVYYYGLLGARRPGLVRMTTIGGGTAMGIDELGRLSDCVDLLLTNRFTPQIAAGLVARRKPYGVYNGAGDAPAGARFFYGFWGYKTGGSPISQWCYHFGNAVFEGAGLRTGDDGYVYNAPDGPLPSLMWEAVREGIDDFRYVQLASQLAVAAEASDDPAVRAAGQKAARGVTALLGNVGWGFQAMLPGDRTPPPAPATLRAWRQEAADIAMALTGKVDVAAATARPLVRPSPLKLPWAAATKAKEHYGPEMLAGGDFEKGLGSWRVEVWKAPGRGAVDADVCYAGRKSVRLDIPAEASNQTVTVLVLPGYGPSPTKIALPAGKTYELSARIRWQGRSLGPQLRIALPDAAGGVVRSGQDAPDAAGWVRQWIRATPAKAAEVKYLAVWLQGPGTVWVDDASLREVLPAPKP